MVNVFVLTINIPTMNYHNNSTTNKVQREQIQLSTDKTSDLAKKYCVSTKTINKWRNRSSVTDRSSRPKRINYSLTEWEQKLVVTIRQLTWLTADELTDCVKDVVPKAGHSNVSRTLKRYGVNRVPKPQREERKTFKSYEPGFIHIDITYLPTVDKKRAYLFVAIDRATRLVYVEVHGNKKAETTKGFFQRATKFYPFKIQKVLTDNGTEFNFNGWKRHKTKPKKQHLFVQAVEQSGAEYRHTKFYSPWTNGLVERMNQTIKKATIRQYRYEGHEDMSKAILNFVMMYNLYRKHNMLNRKTPYQVMCEWYLKKPKIFKKKPSHIRHFYVNAEQRGDT